MSTIDPAAPGETPPIVIDAEEAAIAQYGKIIRLCDGYDFVTQDLCITLLADEQQHRREFVGFLKEYEKS